MGRERGGKEREGRAYLRGEPKDAYLEQEEAPCEARGDDDGDSEDEHSVWLLARRQEPIRQIKRERKWKQRKKVCRKDKYKDKYTTTRKERKKEAKKRTQ